MMKVLQRVSLVLVALFTTLSSWAQVTFRAEAPALTAVGQPFRIEFTMDAEPDRDSFKAPDFSNFDVLAGPSVSTGRSVQFVNGHQTSSYSCTYTYVLMPTTAGKFSIGAASVSVDGASYKSNTLLIEVIAEKEDSRGDSSKEDNSGTVSNDDVLLRFKVSDTDVYKGEAIRASLVLYTRVSISEVSDIHIPSFDGFWSQELTFDNTPSREEYDGKIYETYKVTELLLSPQQCGTLTLAPATMSVRIPVEVQSNRTYDPIFGGRQIHYVNRELSSIPTNITVREFPKGAPRSFNGAVGDFRISWRMPSSEVECNSASQIEVTISGNGNLKFITAPTVLLPESFEVYDTKIMDNITVSTSGTSGSITYTYPFVPRSVGEFTINPIEFSFFNPTTGEYQTLATDSFTLTVTDDGSQPSDSASVGHPGYGSSMRQLDRDIRFIHTGRLPQNSAGVLLFSPIYWLLVVVIVALFIISFVLLRKRIRDSRNVVARRMKHADKVAVQRLRMAERSMSESDRHGFYEEMLRAMWGYISDKFNIPVSNLTKERIREELYRRGVATSVAEAFCEIISRSEEAQYAPSTDSQMSEVYSEAVDIISKIEDVVKR